MNRKVKNITVILLSLIMLISTFTSLWLFGAGKKTVIASSYSYSDIISINSYRYNISFSTINENINKPKEKTKYEKFKSGVKDSKDWVGGFSNFASTLLKDLSSGASSDKLAKDLFVTSVNTLASFFGCSGLTNTVFGLIFGSGPSTEDVIIDALNESMNGVHDHLDAIEEQISGLSEQIQTSTDKITSEMANTIENNEIKNIIQSFNSSKEGNFDYTVFKQYLYGDTDNAYYYNLKEILELENSTDEDIKLAYDNLYKALKVNSVGANASPLPLLKQYILDNNTSLDDSIVKTYYNFLVTNSNELERLGVEDIEAQCLMFLLDLYSTYVLAEQVTIQCYNYQLAYLIEHDSESYYKLQNSDIQLTRSNIVNNFKASLTNQIEVLNQMAIDLAYVFNMENSYILQYGNEYSEIKKSDLEDNTERTSNLFGTVRAGEKIHINTFGEFLDSSINIFDKSKFSIITDNSGIVDIDDNGIVTVKDGISNEEFTIALCYNENSLYSINFNVISNDSTTLMGEGTSKNPYLIETAEQLIAVESDKSYKLVKNIDLNGQCINLSKGGTYSGIFDGNGYTIRNFGLSLETSGTTQEGYDKFCFGFVGTNNGTIKNIIFENVNINISKTKDGLENLYVGGVAGLNNGTIENCMIENYSSLEDAKNKIQAIHYRDVNGDSSSKVQLGGIVGRNEKEASIKNSVVSNCYLYGYSNIGENTGNPHCNVGGIFGENGGVIQKSVVMNSNINSAGKGGKYISSPLIGLACAYYIRSGAIGGYMKDGNILHAVEFNNIIKSNFEKIKPISSIIGVDNSYALNSCCNSGLIVGGNDTGKSSAIKNCYYSSIDQCTKVDGGKSNLYDATCKEIDKTLTLEDVINTTFDGNRIFPEFVAMSDAQVYPNNIYPTSAYESIKFKHLPSKNVYITTELTNDNSENLSKNNICFDKLNLSGLTVVAELSNEIEYCLTNYQLSFDYDEKLKEIVIKAQFENLETCASIKVVDKKVEQLILESRPTNDIIVVKSIFDTTGMVVKKVYNDGTYETLESTQLDDFISCDTSKCGINTDVIMSIDGVESKFNVFVSHNYSETIATVNHTLSEDGYVLRKCVGCGDEEKTDIKTPCLNATIIEDTTSNPNYIEYKCGGTNGCGCVMYRVQKDVATSDFQLKVVNKKTLSDKEIVLDIIIDNNAGIWGLNFELPLNSTQFEYISYDVSNSIFKDCDINIVERNGKQVISFNGNGVDTENNITTNGIVLSVKVKVKAESGTKISMFTNINEAVDCSGNNVNIKNKYGVVTVLANYLGDVNGDNEISNADILLISKYIYNSESYPIEDLSLADINKDGRITNKDILSIKKYLFNPDMYDIVA